MAEMLSVDHPSARHGSLVVDWRFLDEQTQGDADLKCDVLALFVAQVRRVLTMLRSEPDERLRDAAHLLVGSARAVGAWRAARAAEVVQAEECADRVIALLELDRAFAEAVAEIEANLPQRACEALSTSKGLL